MFESLKKERGKTIIFYLIRFITYINNLINILFIISKYESHKVSVFKHFTVIPK